MRQGTGPQPPLRGAAVRARVRPPRSTPYRRRSRQDCHEPKCPNRIAGAARRPANLRRECARRAVLVVAFCVRPRDVGPRHWAVRQRPSCGDCAGACRRPDSGRADTCAPHAPASHTVLRILVAAARRGPVDDGLQGQRARGMTSMNASPGPGASGRPIDDSACAKPGRNGARSSNRC